MPCGIPVAFPCIASSTYVIEQSLQLDCHVVLETPETATAMRRPRVRRMRRRLGGARGGGGGDGGATRRTTTQDAGRTTRQESAQYGGGSQKRHRQVEARQGVFCRYSGRSQWFCGWCNTAGGVCAIRRWESKKAPPSRSSSWRLLSVLGTQSRGNTWIVQRPKVFPRTALATHSGSIARPLVKRSARSSSS